MRQRGYAIAFLLVILLTCAGGFIGGRFVWSRLQEDFSPRPTAVPPAALPVLTPEPAVPSPAPPPTAPRTPTRVVIPTPVAPTQAPRRDRSLRLRPPRLRLPPPPPPPTGTTPTPTAAPSTSQPTGFLFDLARPVRHSAGDCQGSYVLGQVTDRAGNPLPGIGLWLGDEYGYEDTKITKSGQGDVGRYDFPIFGTPRRLYLAVVDASGHPISPKVEILHGLGADAQATCHWVDWQRQ